MPLIFSTSCSFHLTDLSREQHHKVNPDRCPGHQPCVASGDSEDCIDSADCVNPEDRIDSEDHIDSEDRIVSEDAVLG